MPKRSEDPETQRLQARAVDLYDKAMALWQAHELLAAHARLALLEAWQRGASLSDVAETVGINRSTLYHRLEQAQDEALPWPASFPDAARVTLDGRPVFDHVTDEE